MTRVRRRGGGAAVAVVFLATVAAVCGAPDCSRQPVDKLRVTMAGINLIKSFESFHGPCYLDKLVSKKDYPAGLWTVGYGHACPPGLNDKVCKCCRAKGTSCVIDEAYALKLLAQDVSIAEQCIRRVMPGATLKPQEFSAIASLAYNLGCGKFRKASLVKYIKNKQYDKVPGNMKQWRKSGGKVRRGLVRRRKEEVALWNSGDCTSETPPPSDEPAQAPADEAAVGSQAAAEDARTAIPRNDDGEQGGTSVPEPGNLMAAATGPVQLLPKQFTVPGGLGALKDKLSGLTDMLGGLSGKLGGLTGKLGGLTGKLDGALGGLSGKLGGLPGGEKLGGALSSATSKLSGQVAAATQQAEGAIQGVQAKANEAISQATGAVEGLQAQANTALGQLNRLKTLNIGQMAQEALGKHLPLAQLQAEVQRLSGLKEQFGPAFADQVAAADALVAQAGGANFVQQNFADGLEGLAAAAPDPSVLQLRLPTLGPDQQE